MTPALFNTLAEMARYLVYRLKPMTCKALARYGFAQHIPPADGQPGGYRITEAGIKHLKRKP